jgi:MFS transporter, AAHS family, 4-hydroxybenzoate transporter
MSSPRRVDVQQFIDSNPLSRLQYLVLIFCFSIVFIDGYDVGIIGFVAPALSRSWHVPPAGLSPVLSAALAGFVLGSLISGPLADKFGRKRILTISVFFFGTWTLVSAFAPNIGALTVLRLLAGVGLGAATPNATTLTAEYCPSRRRSLLVTIMFCGFTLGSAGGGVIGGLLVPKLGWQSAFLLGGIIPLAFSGLLLAFLPESIQFLVLHQEQGIRRIANILSRIDANREFPANTLFVLPESPQKTSKTAVGSLFEGNFRFGTIMLWITYFMGLLVIFLIRSWLPTLATTAGLSIERASALGAMFDLGGTLGAILVGWCMDHYNAHATIAISFCLGGSAILVLSRLLEAQSLIIAVVFSAGFFLSGSQTSLLPLGAAFYPTDRRATGVSWMLGIGRFGGILGAYCGGILVGRGWEFRAILASLVIPTLIAAGSAWLKGRWYFAVNRVPARVST